MFCPKHPRVRLVSLTLTAVAFAWLAQPARAIDFIPLEIAQAYRGHATLDKQAAALAGFHTLLRQLPLLTPMHPCWHCSFGSMTTSGPGIVGPSISWTSTYSGYLTPSATHTFHVGADADLAPLGAPVRLADTRLILAGSFDTARDFVIGHPDYAAEYRPEHSPFGISTAVLDAGGSGFIDTHTHSPAPPAGGPGYIDTLTHDLKITGVVVAHQRLYKEGAGTLWLTGANVWHASPVVVNGILKGDATSLATAIDNRSSVEFHQLGEGVYAHVVSGGQVIKSGDGMLTFTQAQAYSSDTRIDAGTLALRGAGSVRGVAVGAAGRLDLAGEGALPVLSSLSGAGEVVLGTRGLVLDIVQPGAAFGGNINGEGGLTVLNQGISLAGVNGFSGGLRVQDSTLAAARGDSLGAGSVTLVRGVIDLGDGARAPQTLHIVDNGTLRIETNADWAGRIEGGGTLYKAGDGALVLSAANPFSGDLTLRKGRLALHGAGSIDAVGKTAVDDFAVLDLTGAGGDRRVGVLDGGGRVELGGHMLIVGNGGAFGVFGGVIGGAGGLVKTGAGTQVLTGFNTYEGDTWIQAGVLQVRPQSLGARVRNDATLEFEATGGLHAIQAYSGDIDGAGRLVKSGDGVLWLRGTNAYTGGTLIASGALIGNTDSLAGAIETHAGLAFYQVSDGTFGGTISGGGTLLAYGPGALTLAGINTHRGGTVFSNTLRVADDRALGDRASELLIAGGRLQALAPLLLDRRIVIGNDGGVLDTQVFRVEQLGRIDGAGDLVVTGSGELVLAQGSRHTGATRVESGVLRLQGDLAGSLQILSGVRLIVADADGVTRLGGDLVAQGELFFATVGGNGFSLLDLDGMAHLDGVTLLFDKDSSANWLQASVGKTLLSAAGGISGFEHASVDWGGRNGLRLVQQGNSLVFAAAPVPEADTWAMLLAGLGLVGFAVRRQRLHGAA